MLSHAAEKTYLFSQDKYHLINQTADSPSVDYCVRVTANDGAIGDTYLNQFKDNDKTIPNPDYQPKTHNGC